MIHQFFDIQPRQPADPPFLLIFPRVPSLNPMRLIGACPVVFAISAGAVYWSDELRVHSYLDARLFLV